MTDAEKYRDRLRLSALEADIAYFDAKLSLLQGQPPNTHRKAQVRVYQALESMLSSHLSRLARRQADPGMGDIEVVEVPPAAAPFEADEYGENSGPDLPEPGADQM